MNRLHSEFQILPAADGVSYLCVNRSPVLGTKSDSGNFLKGMFRMVTQLSDTDACKVVFVLPVEEADHDALKTCVNLLSQASGVFKVEAFHIVSRIAAGTKQAFQLGEATTLAELVDPLKCETHVHACESSVEVSGVLTKFGILGDSVQSSLPTDSAAASVSSDEVSTGEDDEEGEDLSVPLTPPKDESDPTKLEAFYKKRNALYSKRNYYKKKNEVKRLQSRSYQLQAEHHDLMQENKRLEALMASVQRKVAMHETMMDQERHCRMSAGAMPPSPMAMGMMGNPMFLDAAPLALSELESRAAALREVIHRRNRFRSMPPAMRGRMGPVMGHPYW